MQFIFNNVNDAFRGMVEQFQAGRNSELMVRTTSRNGDTYRFLYPVCITYKRPWERVLFSEARDANPFFHLYEALWMLAGREDVAPLEFYNSKIKDFSDDGVSFNGAYGNRWREGRAGCGQTWVDDGDPLFVDQLTLLINHLKAQPDSRRAVLQTWNVEDDLLKIGPDIEHTAEACKECGGSGITPGTESTYCKFCVGTKIGKKAWTEILTSKDVCCNLSAVFKIRKEPNKFVGCNPRPMLNDPTDYLDMTVFNRSNDTIWGALGANVVHFSMLQEYMANCLGVCIGMYHQVSCDMHVYDWNWHPEEWLAEPVVEYPQDRDRIRLVREPAVFDKEVCDFVEAFEDDHLWPQGSTLPVYREPFLEQVAKPMCLAFIAHKRREYQVAAAYMTNVQAIDWRVAGTNWISKRAKAWHIKHNRTTSV